MVMYGAIALFLMSWLSATHVQPWLSWHAEGAVFLAALLANGVGVRRAGLGGGVALPLPAMPLLVLLFVAMLQWWGGQIPFGGDAFVLGLYLVLSVGCLCLGYAAGRGGGTAHRPWDPLPALALGLLLVGLASVFIAFSQVLELWESSGWIMRMHDLRRPGANLVQSNHLATLLVMAMACTAFLHQQSLLGRVSTMMSLLMLGAGLALTESRTGLLSMGVLLLWWLWKQPQVAPGAGRSGAVLSAVMVVGMFLAWPYLYEALQSGAGAKMETRLVEGSLRFQVWPQLIEAMFQKPWGGWGILQVPVAHNAVAHAYPVSEAYTYSHNLVLDLAIWVGLPLALLTLLGALIWAGARVRATQTLLPWFGFALALPVGIHSMLEYPHAYAYFLAPLMLALGLIEGALGVPPWRMVGRRWAALGLVVWAVLLLGAVRDYVLVEEDFRAARFQMMGVGQTPADYKRPNIHLLTQLGALTDSAWLEIRPGMNAEELSLLRAVALRHPWTATQYRYALALALNGQPQESQRQLEVIRAQRGDTAYRKLHQELERSRSEWGATRWVAK